MTELLSVREIFTTRGRFHKLVCALHKTIHALRLTFEKFFAGVKDLCMAQNS